MFLLHEILKLLYFITETTYHCEAMVLATASTTIPGCLQQSVKLMYMNWDLYNIYTLNLQQLMACK